MSSQRWMVISGPEAWRFWTRNAARTFRRDMLRTGYYDTRLVDRLKPAHDGVTCHRNACQHPHTR